MNLPAYNSSTAGENYNFIVLNCPVTCMYRDSENDVDLTYTLMTIKPDCISKPMSKPAHRCYPWQPFRF